MKGRIEKPEHLTAWLNEERIPFQLSLKEAEIILGYLEGSAYSLETEDGILFLCDDVEEKREKTEIDDVVQKVCETNYELIEETAAKIMEAEISADTRLEEDSLARLMEDEKALALVFLQTRFQKGLEQALRQAAEKKKTPADRARR
ncbi:hypothetical protein MR857_14650 [bacterium]|jgi:hypothetical protein|uniref:hypothetical protein n=1 Tax=Agathobacter rectalis TaxID=39491 RepID=UPI0027D2F07A|nr:hypothetical protein [Agathobacter rectalis]MCB6950201.1 hypothetical protein [Agathobacter rectalis]MCI6044528.1 hypothetical protein [bacterium]MDY3022518.1 hypothetical protein [Oliverpabstia sp.]MDY3999570.1 hypothetical protein [Blautia sp.]